MRYVNTDPRRWVLVLIFILAGVLIVTDWQLSSIGNKLDRNYKSTIDNRRLGCFNAEALNQIVPPVCVAFHIPVPPLPPVGSNP